MWFGGLERSMDASIYQTVTVIDTSATHLTFYIWAANFDTTTKSGIEAYIDSDLVFRLDKTNVPTFFNSYHVMQVDIREFADGNLHVIKFHFSGVFRPGGIVTSVFLDFANLIQSNVLGDTEYNWPAVQTCSTGCPTNYATDDECDTPCNNAQCGFDKGKCECEEAFPPFSSFSSLPSLIFAMGEKQHNDSSPSHGPVEHLL